MAAACPMILVVFALFGFVRCSPRCFRSRSEDVCTSQVFDSNVDELVRQIARHKYAHIEAGRAGSATTAPQPHCTAHPRFTSSACARFDSAPGQDITNAIVTDDEAWTFIAHLGVITVSV